jgi:ubiquinone/menaquinone biosynthesis C-methylase UbiE
MPNKGQFISAVNKKNQEDLEYLNQKLEQWYNTNSIVDYFCLAHKNNLVWNKGSNHYKIIENIVADMRVLDFGCGSGHGYENLRNFNISYTGIDWSRDTIEENKKKYNLSTFFQSSLYNSSLEDSSFDLVYSLYVLEHLVYPNKFINEIYRITKIGGKIIIICPEYRKYGRISSLKYGIKIKTLKNKIKDGNYVDALIHLFNRNIFYPLFLKLFYPKRRFPFLININPTCLSGEYYPDNDAVYFVDQKEIEQQLIRLGCEIEKVKKEGNATCLIVAKKIN